MDDESVASNNIIMTSEILNYLILLIVGSTAVPSDVVVTTTGKLRGELIKDGKLQYYSYKGIPYAEKPTGNLRFKPPLPKTPWSGVLDATEHGKVCPQKEKVYKREQMSEDCLFLNVYVPVNRSTKLPVLVMVHGGEFQSLSGNDDYIYGPDLFMERGVILVTVNYRLGALGFLSLDVKEASGNAAIKDVILALKWIKTNIEQFGGDSTKITLGGISAGAALAHSVLLSTKASGLFQQALLISGSVLSFRFFSLHPKENALALGRQLNFPTCNTTELLLNLRQADAFDIVAAHEDMGINDTRKGLRAYSPFVPSVEVDYDDAVITKHPLDIIRDGIPQNVPILAGFNSQEGIKMLPTVYKNHTLIQLLNGNFELLIPSNIEYPYGSKQSKGLAQSIRQFYFKGDDILYSTLNDFVYFITDIEFSFPVDHWIKLHKARYGSNKLYYYVFNFDGELNFFKVYNKVDFPGTSHADELGYLFKTNATASLLSSIDSRTHRALDNMMSVVTNFIKFGNPTSKQHSNNFTWPPIGKQRNYLILNDQPQHVTNSSYTDYFYFWYKVYDEYFTYLKNGGELEAKVVP